jgi:protein-L-isoaspartate(D-aspartate) O-methyltransferase
VVVTGAVAELPTRWLAWLAPGTRLLVVRGDSPAQQATLLTQTDAGTQRETTLFETDLPYLLHAEPAPAFVF